jgi:hypothetical protein
MKRWLPYFASLFIFLICCRQQQKEKQISPNPPKAVSSYINDRDFLNKYTPVVELHENDSRILIAPAYQGRVMTSSCKGDSGYSFGWINYDLITSRRKKEHINPFGGEERLWLAPEGGQYSFFFKKDVPYDFEHWFTPREFDTDSFDINHKSDTEVSFSKRMKLINRSGTSFTIRIDRKITLLSSKTIAGNLQLSADSLYVVAYRSENTIINEGKNSWIRKSGAPAIWLLGMLKPTPKTTIVLPLKKQQGDTSVLVHDSYFGRIPPDRWVISGDHAFLKADGKFRGKVGIPSRHATSFIGSYDAENNILTLVESINADTNEVFVNSAWEDQKDPFSGDVFNAYNDGPLKDGSQLGPFYELESLSPAAFLKPGKSLSHVQITYHLQGDAKELNNVARQVLGVALGEIEKVF